MFDIKIGTVIPATAASTMMPQLNAKGFESYELDFNGTLQTILPGMKEHAAKINEAKGGSVISSCGYYFNTLLDEEKRGYLKELIKNAHLYDCKIVSVFAGGEPDKSIPETMPLFKKVFTELCSLAEENGVTLALEGCGEGWYQGCTNMAYCPHAWDLMFENVPSKALMLEWEPAHAVNQLMDPVAQLRHYAKKVAHIHGKDGTVAWDIIREHGMDAGYNVFFDRTPGFGDSNWADFFTILLMNGFEGSCDIEGYHDPVHFDDVEWSAQLTALDYLKRCRGGVENYEGPVEYRGYQGKRKK